MTVRYKLLSLADASVLLDVDEEAFDAPVDPGRALAYLADTTNLMVVAIDGGKVIGQCAAVIHRHPDQPTELYIDNLGVAPAWQRRGVARALLRQMFEAGRARGCVEAWVGTEPDNEAANGLYRSLDGAAAETFNFYLYKL